MEKVEDMHDSKFPTLCPHRAGVPELKQGLVGCNKDELAFKRFLSKDPPFPDWI